MAKPDQINVYLFKEDAHLLKVSAMWADTLGWPQYVATLPLMVRRKDKAEYVVHRGTKFEVEPCTIKGVKSSLVPFYKFVRRMMSAV